MLDKDTQRKIESCKALQGKTVEELIATDRFRRKQIRASYEAMRKLGGAKGYKLPAHPIDRVIDLPVDDFAAEYMAVIARVSERPVAERRYIQQLGQQAYNLTVAQYVVEEYPELADELIPKSKAN